LLWSNLDVSVDTPGWTPGVLDEDVVSSVIGTVTNSEDTVIELGTASGGDDTTGVSLENGLVGLDGNGDWVLGDGGEHLGLVTLLDISVGLDVTLTLGGLVLALSLSGSVLVVRLEHEWGLLDVLEGVVHETTVAAHVTEGAGAVNKLLLGVGLEGSGGEEHSTLDGTGGGESPA